MADPEDFDDATDDRRIVPSVPPVPEDDFEADADLDELQTDDVSAALPTNLPAALLQDIADRRGFPLLGTTPAARRALDEPLVLATTGVRSDRDQDEEDLLRLLALEAALTAWVLARHWPAWEAFCAAYPKNVDDQPPDPADARYVAEACRRALARNVGVPDAVRTRIPRAVRARLHRWCCAHPPDGRELRDLIDEITRIREQFLLRNGRLASYIARRVYHQGLTWRERLAFGFAGLGRALDSFDPTRGASFATYARKWIQARVSRAANETGTPMRCVGNFAELRMKVARHARERIWHEVDVPALHPIVANATPERRALVEVGLVLQTATPHQLAALLDKDLASAADTDRWEVLWDELERALADLQPRLRTILERRWGLDPRRTRHTLAEIGQHENLSRERIRQLEREAIANIRDQLADSTSPTSSGSPSSSS